MYSSAFNMKMATEDMFSKKDIGTWENLRGSCVNGDASAFERLNLIVDELKVDVANYQADLVVKEVQLYKPIAIKRVASGKIKIVAFILQILGLVLMLLSDIPTFSKAKYSCAD